MDTNSIATDRPPIILTDGTCDLPTAIFEQYNIQIMPLKLMFGEETYYSGVDMNLDQFIERLARDDVHPTSSPPSAPEFKERYEALGKDGTPILSIHVNEGLSNTVNAARQAAQELPNRAITVWDSGTICGALGLQVLTAARAAHAGHTIEQITPLLEQTHAAGNLLFCMDDLSFLLRGGRIGLVIRYHVAQTFHIKPIITISKSGDKAGTYISVGRARGLEKAVDAFVQHVVEAVGEGNKLRALALYGDDPTPALAAKLNEQLKQHFECVYLEMTLSTPVLAVHVGAKALAVAYAAGDWPV